MRDEFPAVAREELAKRVGYLCSRPACRRPTSGPQDGATGVVNIGVAAHITSASRQGPRYDADLDRTGRTSTRNGIWLCQTCAKLIDSDVGRFTIDKLLEWKADAETAAQTALEERRSPATESVGVYLEAERLMPAFIAELRTDIRDDQTELVREIMLIGSRGWAVGSNKPRFFYVTTELPNLQIGVDWLEEMGLVTDITTGKIPLYRLSPDFVGWLRDG